MIKQVEMYVIACDGCGKVCDSDGMFAWTDEHSAKFMAFESEWKEIEDKHYCPDCYEYDDSIEEYVPKQKGGEK